MCDLDFEIPAAVDPFAEEESGIQEIIHIRIQQRNGKKSLTTVQGLTINNSDEKKLQELKKILKELKKAFCCNGNVVQDKVLGMVIQLQGDQRKNVADFLVQGNFTDKDHIKIHGF